MAAWDDFGACPASGFWRIRTRWISPVYRLLVAIEAALALCYHVSAKRLRKVPEEYAECFGMLRDAGILPAELAGRLQRMARSRNLLVHMYWKIAYGQVFDVIQQNLGDLRAFGAAVLRMADS